MMKEFIEDRLNKIKEDYRRNEKLRVTTDYNIEKKSGEAYHGRELLELMQNADDELVDELSAEIKISFNGSILTVSNYGRPFTTGGVDSLMHCTLSPKAEQAHVIGHKGTGFTSILGWADTVTIHSGDLHIQFSDTYAQMQLKDLLGEEIVKQKKLKSATLVFPKWIDEENDSPYTTDIKIGIKNDPKISEDIESQLNSLSGDLLLFLNHTKILTIETDKTIQYKKETQGKKTIITKFINANEEERTTWHVKSKNGTIGDKNYSITVAYKDDWTSPAHQVIYSYFPTDVDFPYPLLLHGTFNLNQDRNHLLKKDPENKVILNDAADLLINVALEAAKGKPSYKPLSLLIPQKPLNKELDDYDFEEILVDKILHSNILPTVNNSYISFDNDPVFYETEFAKILKGENFRDLLLYAGDEERSDEIISFLNEHDVKAYTEDYFIKILNDWAKNHTFTPQNIKDHSILIAAYAEEYANTKGTESPALIFDSDEHKTNGRTTIFLKEQSSEISTPPSFAGIRFMHPGMQKVLAKQLGTTVNRTFADKLSCFNVREYNATPIIQKMASSIQKALEKGRKDIARRHAIEELKWLWKNRETLYAVNEGFVVYLPTRGGSIARSDKLYYGKEYGNDVCENLLKYSAFGDVFVADIREYIDAKNDIEILELFSKINVARFPRIINESITNIESDYKQSMLQSLEYPLMLGGDQINDPKELLHGSCKIKGAYIAELETILSVCPTAAILDWIIADHNLQQILYSGLDLSGQTEVLWGYKQYYRPIPQQMVYPHLCWQFNTLPWIEVNEKKYAVNGCILTSIGDALAPLLVEPEIDEYVKDKEHHRRLADSYVTVLENIGVVKSYNELPVSKLYQVLLKLPDVEASGNISKSIYSALTHSDYDIDDAEKDNEFRKEFLEHGKVYCKNDAGYQDINKVFYLDNNNVCQSVCSQFNLIDIPGHQSVNRIESIFGIKKLILKGTLTKKPTLHALNDSFQEDFNKFKILAFCYRMDTAVKDETRRFGGFSIALCTNLEVSYNNKPVEHDEYEYMFAKSNLCYLKIPAEITLPSELNNVDMAGAIAEILSSFFDSNRQFQEYRELYSAGNDASRRKLLLQKYGDEDIFERSAKAINAYESNEDEFYRIVTKLSGCDIDTLKPLCEEIDFDNINLQSNCIHIINLFKKFGIDIAQYNEVATLSVLSLQQYYKGKVTQLQTKYKQLFKQSLYERLKNKPIKDKTTLVNEFLSFDYRPIVIEDSVFFEYEKVFLEAYEIDLTLKPIDFAELYAKNKEEWVKTLKKDSHVEGFLNLPENQSLLYFKEYDELNRRYDDYIAVEYPEEPEEVPETISFIPEIYVVSTEPSGKKVRHKNGPVGRTGFTKSTNEQTNTTVGRMGEKHVYNALRAKYTSVEWVSENAKKEGVNPEGSAGYGYDMNYENSDGKKIYVEVKASKSDAINFYLSESEFRIALQHPNEYELYFVKNALNEQAEILRLTDLFVDNDLNKEKYTVEVSHEYAISADEIQRKK